MKTHILSGTGTGKWGRGHSKIIDHWWPWPTLDEILQLSQLTRIFLLFNSLYSCNVSPYFEEFLLFFANASREIWTSSLVLFFSRSMRVIMGPIKCTRMSGWTRERYVSISSIYTYFWLLHERTSFVASTWISFIGGEWRALSKYGRWLSQRRENK